MRRVELCLPCPCLLSSLELEVEMTKTKGVTGAQEWISSTSSRGSLLGTGPIMPCVGNTEINGLSQGAPITLSKGGDVDIIVSFLILEGVLSVFPLLL